jgi:hypothetical protein
MSVSLTVSAAAPAAGELPGAGIGSAGLQRIVILYEDILDSDGVDVYTSHFFFVRSKSSRLSTLFNSLCNLMAD